VRSWRKTYHANFLASITSDVIEMRMGADIFGTTPVGAPIARFQRRRTAMIHPSLLLRRAILGDAIFSGAGAALFGLGAAELAPLLNLPEALLRETGLFLVAYAALVGWLGSRQSMPKALVILVISGNAAWAVASIALLFSGAVTPNLLGEAVVAAQAIVVGALAELQYIGLRRSGGAIAA
jgi:hypothetical protein